MQVQVVLVVKAAFISKTTVLAALALALQTVVVAEGAAAGEHVRGELAATPVQVFDTPAVAAKAAPSEQVPIEVTTVPLEPNLTVPATANVAPGLVVPMPTLPAGSIAKRAKFAVPSFMTKRPCPLPEVPLVETMSHARPPVPVFERVNWRLSWVPWARIPS